MNSSPANLKGWPCYLLTSPRILLGQLGIGSIHRERSCTKPVREKGIAKLKPGYAQDSIQFQKHERASWHTAIYKDWDGRKMVALRY